MGSMILEGAGKVVAKMKGVEQLAERGGFEFAVGEEGVVSAAAE